MLIPKKMSSIHDENILVSDKGNAQNGYVYNAASFRRYYASFPCYPFRTLCPRDADQMLGGSVFDQNSPVIPAHTQINAKFTRRPAEQLLNWMLPSNLDYDLGSRARGLDDGQRRSALNFTALANIVNTQYQITGMEVVIRDLYLQVRIERIDRVKRETLISFFLFQVTRLKYKGISPERPLSNIYTCLRVHFTPVQKVSQHTYDVLWPTHERPGAGYFAFVK